MFLDEWGSGVEGNNEAGVDKESREENLGADGGGLDLRDVGVGPDYELSRSSGDREDEILQDCYC